MMFHNLIQSTTYLILSTRFIFVPEVGYALLRFRTPSTFPEKTVTAVSSLKSVCHNTFGTQFQVPT